MSGQNYIRLLFFGLFPFILGAQSNDGIVIKVEGIEQDYSSGQGIFVVNASDEDLVNDEILIDLDVINTTGQEQTWRATRSWLNVPQNWQDLICLDICYIPSTLNPYCTPSNSPMIIGNDSTKRISFHVQPMGDAFAEYRLYLGDCETFVDSITIQINYILGINSFESQIGRIYPNPTNRFVQVELPNQEELLIEIKDNAGKLICRAVQKSSDPLDLQGIKKGCYFLTVRRSNGEVLSKKLIIDEFFDTN